jgi:hypothetical protein
VISTLSRRENLGCDISTLYLVSQGRANACWGDQAFFRT